MSARQKIMSFRYRALFQSLDIHFFKTMNEKSITIFCEADIKLPILKKSYRTSTEFSVDEMNWLRHSPVQEAGGEEKWVSKNQDLEQSVDPIGFFMMFDHSSWSASEVNLLIGAKVVNLAVKKIEGGHEISRPEKNQKLRVISSSRGIEKIEVPLPVIGAVAVERVW
jgi:hypothetical protein